MEVTATRGVVDAIICPITSLPEMSRIPSLSIRLHRSRSVRDLRSGSRLIQTILLGKGSKSSFADALVASHASAALAIVSTASFWSLMNEYRRSSSARRSLISEGTEVSATTGLTMTLTITLRLSENIRAALHRRPGRAAKNFRHRRLRLCLEFAIRRRCSG